jgi:hypothetical protein
MYSFPVNFHYSGVTFNNWEGGDFAIMQLYNRFINGNITFFPQIGRIRRAERCSLPPPALFSQFAVIFNPEIAS